MSFATADLCDAHGERLQVAEPVFQDFGASGAFEGGIATVRALEDNTQVRAMLETAGDDRVLVVDGGGSRRCALVGDRLAQLAIDNGWAGLVVFGCVRDSAALRQMPVGIKALGVCPRRSRKLGQGERDVAVAFAGVSFEPGAHLYADADGVVVSAVAVAS